MLVPGFINSVYTGGGSRKNGDCFLKQQEPKMLASRGVQGVSRGDVQGGMPLWKMFWILTS